MQRRVVALLSDLRGMGGLQRHSRAWLTALREFAHARGWKVDAICFQGASDAELEVRGCEGSRMRFAARALAALWRPHAAVVVGHVDLLPLTLARIRPTPVAVVAHGIEVWRRLPAWELVALRRVDQVWSISEYTSRMLMSVQHLPRESIRLVPCCLDAGFARRVPAETALTRYEGELRLLSVSRMAAHDKDKGIDQVIMALPAVIAACGRVVYTVIGDGEDRARLEALAESVGVRQVVRFLGAVPDEELHAQLSACDVFVLPSRKEGFGIVFLEAMAYGKPVVGGAHGGTPEVIRDGETGLLVRHGDVPGLAAALIRLLSDPHERRRMGEAGRQLVKQRFLYPSLEHRVHEALRELVGWE